MTEVQMIEELCREIEYQTHVMEEIWKTLRKLNDEYDDLLYRLKTHEDVLSPHTQTILME